MSDSVLTAAGNLFHHRGTKTEKSCDLAEQSIVSLLAMAVSAGQLRKLNGLQGERERDKVVVRHRE